MAYNFRECSGEPSDCPNYGERSNGWYQTYQFAVGDDAGYSDPHAGEILLPFTCQTPVAHAESRETPVIKSGAGYVDCHNKNAVAGNQETNSVAYNQSSASEALPMHAAVVELPTLPLSWTSSRGEDTHKIVVDNQEMLEVITSFASPTPSEGPPAQGSGCGGVPSFPDFLSRCAPTPVSAQQGKSDIPKKSKAAVKGQDVPFFKSSGQTKQGKSYIPTFLKPGFQVQAAYDQPRSAAKPASGTIPTFLKPGWGEAPRKPPVPGKKKVSVRRVLGGGHHLDELHLGTKAGKSKESHPDQSTPEKSVGCAGVLRVFENHWKKRSPVVKGPSESTNVNANARVMLAQSGPASLITASVFPKEVVVTPDPCQTAVSVGSSMVSLNDLPSTLRLRHASNAIVEKQDATSPTYKWPLVDMTNELFLNFDPKQRHEHTSRAQGLKHQEPRIVVEEFLESDLHGEFLRELASRDRKRQTHDSRPISQAGLEVCPDVAPSGPCYTVPTVGKEVTAMEGGVFPLESREIPQPPGILLSEAQSSLPTLSDAPAPKQDEGAKETDQADFSWFRFTRVDLEDPADEHCRNYRIRRREMRKYKQEASLARET